MNKIIKPIKNYNVVKASKDVIIKVLMINDGNNDSLKTRLKKLIDVIKYNNSMIKY